MTESHSDCDTVVSEFTSSDQIYDFLQSYNSMHTVKSYSTIKKQHSHILNIDTVKKWVSLNLKTSIKSLSLKQRTLRMSFTEMSCKHVEIDSCTVLLSILISVNIWRDDTVVFENQTNISYISNLYSNHLNTKIFEIESFEERNDSWKIKQFNIVLSLFNISELNDAILDMHSFTDLEIQENLLQLFNFDQNKTWSWIQRWRLQAAAAVQTKIKTLNVRVLLSEWIRGDKNNELDLNVSDILNFVRESAYIVWKS